MYTLYFVPTGPLFLPSTAMLNVPVVVPGTTFGPIAVNPAPAPAGGNATVSGSVTAANGAAPTGTVQVGDNWWPPPWA